ncbi:hypothetical protein [Marispirochaeta aestuarii]|uniref:hypothetical protein n=1 Tax=Marispirochaeta aestuarii TaxID=1963862 RepID=UPI001178743A|nr:hypothetical protein [Marispirochaeta aestuarii]
MFFFFTLQLFTDTSELSLGAGISIDVAPYGIEQTFITIYSTYRPGNAPWLMAKASFSFNRSAVIAGFPLCLIVPLSNGDDNPGLEAWMGGGFEYFHSRELSAFLPLLSAGGRLMLRNVFFDILVESVFRTDKNDIDSSIGFSAGYLLSF